MIRKSSGVYKVDALALASPQSCHAHIRGGSTEQSVLWVVLEISIYHAQIIKNGRVELQYVWTA